MAVVNKNPVRFVCGTFASRYHQYISISQLEAAEAKLKSSNWYDSIAAAPHGKREYTEEEKQRWNASRPPKEK